MKRLGAWLILAALILASAAFPCTTFVINAGDERAAGKNYDWMIGDGLVVVNHRGIAKEAVAADHAASWVSRYGSITFCQYGREFPLGGMNEAGLVAEVMWLDETVYPAPDDRAAVSSLQWVQYVLDTCATVAEVVAAQEDIRVAEGGACIHYLVADASGDAATVEYVAGETIVHAGDRMPWPALANNTYDDSLAFMTATGPAGPDAAAIQGPGSLERFCRAALRARAYNPLGGLPPATDYAFGVLDNVANADWTLWSIVYDPGAKTVAFKTRKDPQIKRVALSDFDFAPEAVVKIRDVNAPGEGGAASFEDYSYERNRALVDAAFDGTDFLKDVPEEGREGMARYPESTHAAP